jgi:MATE family multidrug resistance protein
MVPLSGFLSVAFLGHLAEIRHLAGVTLSTILFNYLYRTLGFLRMSTTGVTAQAFGKDNQEEVLLTGLRNAFIALVLGLTILLLKYPLGCLGFSLLNATLDVKASGQLYYDGRIWGAPATLLNFVLVGWFLGQGKSGKVLLLSVIGNGANVLFDYLFIVRWGWDSAGAGLATAVSQYLMLATGVVLVWMAIQDQDLGKLRGKIFTPSALKETLTLNRDIFIRTLAFLSTFSVFTNLSSAMGTVVLTDNALLLQVITLTVYLVDGLAYATESLTGIFKGKGVNEQLFPLLVIAGQVSFILGITVATSFILFPDTLFGLLTNHREILDHIHHYVFWLLPVLGFGSIAFILDGYFLGLAEGALLRNTALMATLVGFAPVAVIAWQANSRSLLWLSLSSFMLARAALLGLQVPKTLRGF